MICIVQEIGQLTNFLTNFLWIHNIHISIQLKSWFGDPEWLKHEWLLSDGLWRKFQYVSNGLTCTLGCIINHNVWILSLPSVKMFIYGQNRCVQNFFEIYMKCCVVLVQLGSLSLFWFYSKSRFPVKRANRCFLYNYSNFCLWWMLVLLLFVSLGSFSYGPLIHTPCKIQLFLHTNNLCHALRY